MTVVLDDLATKIDADTALTIDTDLFKSGFYDREGAPSTQVALVEYGGLAPSHVLGPANPASAIHPRVQVASRAKDYPVARANAQAVYDSIGNLTDVLLGPTRYHRVVALQEPFDMGPDAAGHQVVGFNVQISRVPT